MKTSIKKLDKQIINGELCLLGIIIFTGLILDFYLTLKVIALIGCALYFFFIMNHLMLCYPLIFIVMWTNDLFESQSISETIKNKSEIIHTAIVVVLCLISCSVVYVLIPYILAMLFNGSVDFNQATTSLGVVLKG